MRMMSAISRDCALRRPGSRLGRADRLVCALRWLPQMAHGLALTRHSPSFTPSLGFSLARLRRKACSVA